MTILKNKLFVVVGAFALLAITIGFFLIKPAPYVSRDAQEKNMEVIALVLEDYRSDRDGFPSEENGVDILFKERYVGNSSFSIDLWGNDLAYAGGGDHYLLYSFGENMVDEAGGGDDIVVCSQDNDAEVCRM